jgi:hypothetical protein
MHNIIYKELEYQDCENICEIIIRLHKKTDTNKFLSLTQKENLWLAPEYSVWMYWEAMQSSEIQLIQTFHAQEVIISCETFLTEYILQIVYAYLKDKNLIEEVEYTTIIKYIEWDRFLDSFLERCEKNNIEYTLTDL